MRVGLFAAAVMACAIVHGAPTQAQTIYGFGDSLLDTRRVCAIPGLYPSGAYGTCSNGKGALEYLPDYSRYSFDKANDYASGGGGTGSYNLAAFLGPSIAVGTDTEIDQFVAAGGHINADDLVVMSGISNNVYQFAGNPSLTGEGLAKTSLAEISHGVGALIGAGARNLVYYGGSPADVGVQEVSSPQATAYTAGINNGLAATLAPFAKPGVRIRILDFEAVYIKAVTDPSYYAFGANAGECTTDPSCAHASLAVQDQRFLYDVHPTQAGEQLLARYIGNLITSDDGVAAQADIAGAGADDFAATLMRRLDAGRSNTADGYASDAARPGQIAMFAEGGHGQSRQDDWAGVGGAADGYTDGQDELDVGASFRADAHTVEGLALGYTRSSGRLNDDAGRVDVDSLHAGAFVSLAWPNRFADLVVTYSRHDLFVDRPGVVGRLDSSSGADTVTAAFQTGWLFPLGPVQVGPLLGVHYDRTHVGAYSESGDPILTQHVEGQTEQTLTASAGLQARSRFDLFERPFQPFLNLTAEHDFLDGDRTLVSENTFARELPIYTQIGSGWRTETYGLLSGGVQAPLGAGLDVVVDGQATAFRRGNGYAVTAAISRAF